LNQISWQHLEEDVTAWMEDAYPNEGCGLIVESDDGALLWIPCENLADKYHDLDPVAYPRTSRTFYIVPPKEFLAAERRGETVRIIVHSHADVGDYFSAEDRAAALFPALGPEEPPEPLFPGVDYLVVSVRDGRADRGTVFRFDEQRRDFEAVRSIAFGPELSPLVGTLTG
jgi:[CysO sulfur-carrier protein]-S-L-cysteine hydrolase